MTAATCTKLLDGGDLACAQHDVEALARIAEQLAARVGDPLKDRLHALSLLCDADSELAAERWLVIREQIAHRFSVAGT